MSRRGENIHKRKDGRWEGRFKDGFKEDGSVKYSSVYAKTYSECKSKLEQAKFYNCEQKTHKGDIYFKELIYKWLEINKMRLKGSTLTKYKNLFETHIICELGNIKISRLNSEVINSFLNRKLESGRINNSGGLSPSYVKTMAVIIEEVINFAINEGYCKKINLSIIKPQNLPKDIITLTPVEEADLLSVIMREKSTTAVGTLIALQTGMRIGEVCALRWKDINFEEETISIKHTVSRVDSNSADRKTMLILDTPKTHSSKRCVPMTKLINQLLSEAFKTRKSDFIVSNNQNFVSTRTFEYQYKKMLKTNALPIYNFHILRHTFATRCADFGMDAKTLSILLGHSNPNTTLNIYIHPSMDSIKQKINNLF